MFLVRLCYTLTVKVQKRGLGEPTRAQEEHRRAQGLRSAVFLQVVGIRGLRSPAFLQVIVARGLRSPAFLQVIGTLGLRYRLLCLR